MATITQHKPRFTTRNGTALTVHIFIDFTEGSPELSILINRPFQSAPASIVICARALSEIECAVFIEALRWAGKQAGTMNAKAGF